MKRQFRLPSAIGINASDPETEKSIAYLFQFY
jgi:hypothetical protein